MGYMKLPAAVSALGIFVSLFGMFQADQKVKPEKPVTVPAVVEHSAPEGFTPSDSQAEKLEIARLKAALAQERWTSASLKLPEHNAYLQSLTDVGQACSSVIAENKWPDTVRCTQNTIDTPITFFDSAPPKPKPSKK